MTMWAREAGQDPSGREISPGLRDLFAMFGGAGHTGYGSRYIPYTTLLQEGLERVFGSGGQGGMQFGNGAAGGLPIGGVGGGGGASSGGGASAGVGGGATSGAGGALTPETIAALPTTSGLGSVAPMATTGAKGGIIGGAAGAGSASAFSTWAPWLNAAVGAGGAYMSADAAKKAAKENSKPRTEYRTPYMNEYISKIVPYLLAQQQSVFENRMGRYNDLSGGKGVSTLDFSPLRALLSQISMSYSGLGDPNRPIMSAPLSGYPDSSNPYNQSATPAPPVTVPRGKYSRIAME